MSVLKSGLILSILLTISACASPPVTVVVEEDPIPQVLLTLPVAPERPGSPRKTNIQMDEYRKLLEEWGCEVAYRYGELVSYISLGEQSVTIPTWCNK